MNLAFWVDDRRRRDRHREGNLQFGNFVICNLGSRLRVFNPNYKLQIGSYKFCPGVSAVPAPIARGTSRHVTVASHATLPSTYALPSRRAAVIRQAFTTTSMRS